MDQSLQDYIIEARSAGTDDDTIRASLLSIGWNKKQVADALAGKSDVSTAPKKISRVWLWIVAFLIIFGGALALFYYNWYAPNALLAAAANNLAGSQSFQYSIDVVPVLGAKGVALANNYSSSPQNIALLLSGGLDLSSSSVKTKTELSIDSPSNSSSNLLDIQSITIGDQAYVFTAASSKIVGSLNISALTNQWWGGKNGPVSNFVNKIVGSNNTTPSSVTAGLKNDPPLAIRKNLGTQMIGSSETQHFQLSINPSNLKVYLIATGDSAVSNGSISRFVNSLTSIDVWINPSTRQIEQIRLVSNMAPYGSAITDYVQSATTTITLTGIGKTPPITAPINVKLLPLLGGS